MMCDRCGATIEESAFCKYCGARVMRPAAGAATTDRARFELAAASPNYAVAMAHEPKAPVVINIVAPLFMAAFGIGFLVLSTTMMGHDDGMPATPAGFRLLFAAIPLAFVGICAWMVVRGVRFARAPVQKALAVVIDERTAVSGGGKDRAVRTTYYATVQFEAGDRLEYETYGWLAGRIAAGDLGVAFTKGHMLIDFLRLEA